MDQVVIYIQIFSELYFRREIKAKFLEPLRDYMRYYIQCYRENGMRAQLLRDSILAYQLSRSILD